MDPITLIVAALTAGVAASTKNVAGQAIKDAYDVLKGLILRKFGDKPKVQEELTSHAEDPDTYGKPIKKVLAQAGADRDQEIIEAAKKLMAVADPEGAAVGKYNIRVSGGQVGVIGDHGTATMYGGGKPEGK